MFSLNGDRGMRYMDALHRHSGGHLRRSADMLRATVTPALDSGLNTIDRSIRLVFTGDGPEYRNADAVGAGPRYICYRAFSDRTRLDCTHAGRASVPENGCTADAM